MSNIFYNEKPLVVNSELACLIGLNESIILQQLHYWIKMNKESSRNFHDGRYWTYGTVQEYRDRDFSFWSVVTVKRTFKILEQKGLLIAGNFNKAKMDRTKWYTINYPFIDELAANRNSQPALQNPASGTQMAGNSPPAPLGQVDPMQQVNVTQSIRSDCPNPLGQVDPLQQVILTQPNRSDCPNPTGQVDPLQQVILTHTIPEIKKEINTQRSAKETNTQKAPSPPASGACVNKPPALENISVDGEAMDTCELLFDEFWKLYPRKESKQQAKKAWLQLNPDQELFNLIANALEYRKQSKEWLAEGGRYVPHPATWLNGRRWEDEVDPQKLCESAAFQEQYGDVLINGKPLDPVQRKQLEYIEKQMRAQANNGEAL